MTQKEGLRRLMDARAPDSSLKDVARALFGMYADVARDCAWPLVRAAKLDLKGIAANMTRAMSVPVNDVKTVSLSEPYADASWATDEGAAALFADGLASGLEKTLDRDFTASYWGRLQIGVEHRVLAGIGETRLEILERDVQTKIMPGLRPALFATLAGPVSVRMVEEAVYGVEETLRSFLAFVIIDDRADAVPLGHLTRLLLGAIPLGAKRDDPGTWLVATA